MKTKILPKILLGAILGIVAFKSDAQNPGGVTAAPAIWYNPASYTTNTWPNSGTFTGCDLTNSGNPVYSNGDKASNYNPYVYYVFTNSTTLGILSTNDQVSYSNAITAAQATLLQQNTTFSGLLPTNLSGSATHAPSVFRFSDNQYAANHGYSIGGYNEGLPYCYISGFYNNGSGYVNEIGAGTADTFSYRSVILAMQPQAATSPVKFNFGLNGHYRTTTNSYYGPGYNGGAPSATTYQYICVGRGYYYGMEGRVFDQMVYSGALSTDQMYEVESYLGIKQGITLAHPYYAASDDGTSLGTTIWNTGNTGGYDNNIAGIGNETANGSLDQRQSNSVNAGQQVLIGTTGLGNSNSANGTNLTNGQYLMWGDNGLAKTPKIPETNIAGTNYRFAAVWKVQNTNAVGTVRVAWPAGLNGLKLVQSSDPTFASGNTATDMSANTQTVNGVTYNYADVTLADGRYFTFAASVVSPGGIASLPAVWYRPDSVSKSFWMDASLNKLNLTGQGAVTINAGDAAHNFNSWTTGYSASNYYNFIDSTATNTDLETNPVFGNYNVNGYSYMPLTVFGVARDTLTSGSGLITGTDNEKANASEPGFGVYAAQQRFYRASYGAAASGTTAPVNVSGVYMWRPPAGISTASGTDTLLMGLNGGYTTAQINKVGSVVGPYLKIGYSASDWGAFPGNIQEVIWYKDSLGYGDIQKVETYLALKFGTTLAHSYINAAGDTVYNFRVNAGYVSNIAGIGHEAANGALDQRQSNSVSNTGEQVLISTTGLDNTNDANSVGLSEGKYLIWGDNGLPKQPGVAVTDVNGDNYRFSSVWKVQNTGTVGTVRVAWRTGLTNLKLLQNSDPTFAAGNTATDMSAHTQTIDGVTYNYADVTLTDGQYFTLAALVTSPGGIATLPAVWYKPENVSASNWKDASLNGLDLTGTGTPTINAGDLTHNFQSWTTGYSNTNYFNYLDPTATNTNNEANPVFGNYNVNSYSYMPLTVFGAARPTTLGSGPITGIDNEINTSEEPGFAVYNVGGTLYPRTYRFSNGIDRYANTLPNTIGQTSVYMFKPPYSDTHSGLGALQMGVDGKDTAITGVSAAGSVAGPYLKVGYDGGLGGGFPGDIQEVVWFKDTLKQDDINKVETYLSLKFGTTLKHNYINAANDVVFDTAVNAGYTSNIAGIAHEATNGGLDQRQSASVDAGNQVIISTTGLANTNAENATGLTEGQFLIWGDNGLAKAPSVAISGVTGVNYRFSAVWKVQNTSSVGTVRVAWPAGLSNLTLVQSSDPTFATGNTETNMTANTITVDGVNYNYADVTLANGQYFTFAAQINHAPGGVVNGLSYWYRADMQVDTTATGGTVTNWTDYAWGSTTVSQLGTNDMPVYNYGAANYLNFNPGLNFSNSAQTLGNISVQTVTNTSYDIFTLTSGITSSGYYRVFSSSVNNTPNTSIRFWDGIGLGSTIREREDQGLSDYQGVMAFNPLYATNSPSVMYNTFTPTTVSNGLNGGINGPAATSSTAYDQLTGGFAFGSTVFSNNGSDNPGFTGNLGETIIYGSRNLTPNERNRVDAYLAVKYGITLDNNESYLASNSSIVWDKTDNAAYYNNIAGIARDDMSALNQKQSRSQVTNNANSEITVGLGAITTNNATNANSFTNDQTWFIWGDNGVTTTLDAASAPFTAPAGTGVRMNRIWKAVNTGLSQAVELQFPQASVSATTGAHYVLIMANDENFTTNVSTIDLSATATGNNYTVTFTPRSGTFYFTFARLDVLATPVILKDVSVSTANCNATLSWTGATEINFNYYEVQSSTDGISFTPQQQVSAKGSGSRYTATIPLSAATEYLRLQMVDKDGSSENSDTYTVNSSCGVGTPVLYPNPASDVFNITNLGSGQKQIQVFSASGASVYKSQTTADKTTVNVKGWTPGIYMVSVATGTGKTVSFKVIVR